MHFPEACESVRGFAADVPRYREVLVKGRFDKSTKALTAAFNVNRT